MPVWCENTLHARGPNSAISQWLDAVRLDVQDPDGQPMCFDFNRVVPCPRYLRPELAQLGKFDFAIGKPVEDSAPSAGAYWWCIAHWGTKWNASHVVVTPRRYGAVVSFDTAWSAPFPIIIALLEQYPMLAFSLHYRLEGKRRYQFVDWNKP